MPAYNAELTILKTIENIPKLYERIILCDDHSRDNTYDVSKKLGIETLRHEKNLGYGANQKTLYGLAKKYDPDIIVMIHPDNQYETLMLPKAITMIENGDADFILGTRMQMAKELGMPWWKIASNKFLSFFQRNVYGSNLSEFHSGLRVFKASILNEMPYQKFSDDFVFDSQFIAWCFGHNLKITELPTKCFYNNEVSSINFKRSLRYGFATIKVLGEYLFTDKYTRL